MTHNPNNKDCPKHLKWEGTCYDECTCPPATTNADAISSKLVVSPPAVSDLSESINSARIDKSVSNEVEQIREMVDKAIKHQHIGDGYVSAYRLCDAIKALLRICDTQAAALTEALALLREARCQNSHCLTNDSDNRNLTWCYWCARRAAVLGEGE